IFAYTAFLKGVSLVGPVNGSLLASIEPIASVFFAVWLVNEQFYTIDFVGMLLILLAVLLISMKDLMISRKSIG
nr:EamA family transporter [Streptococcus sp.]